MPVPAPPLRRGDRGDVVAELQRTLEAINRPVDATEYDAHVFGETTEAVLRKLQEQSAISVTGVFDADTFAVLAFHEKPAARGAADLVRRGALWNTLVMVGRVRRVLELLRALRPADVALLEETPRNLAALATVYDRLPAWNFSHEFLSHIPEHLVVTRADDFGWSDWGTPEAIERSFAAMGVVPPWRGPVEAA